MLDSPSHVKIWNRPRKPKRDCFVPKMSDDGPMSVLPRKYEPWIFYFLLVLLWIVLQPLCKMLHFWWLGKPCARQANVCDAKQLWMNKSIPLMNGVLKSCLTGSDRGNLGSKSVYAKNLELLSLTFNGSHENNAFHSNPSMSQTVVVATPCCPASWSPQQNDMALASAFGKKVCPMALLILWAPGCGQYIFTWARWLLHRQVQPDVQFSEG